VIALNKTIKMKSIKLMFLFSAMLAFVACSAQRKSQDYSGAVLVDVRTPGEFAEGSVPGAINIPVDQIEGRLTTLPQHGEIVVFCRSGSRSSRAKSILDQHGFTHVTNGGTWQQVNAVVVDQKSKKQ
jgi:phage shock protein E